MADARNLRRVRGAGLRHTLPFVGRFAGLWLVVTITAVLVASASSYLLFAERIASATARQGFFWTVVVQTALIVIAVLALGVFSTHRLAGPWIAVHRALEEVAAGDLDCELRIRSRDAYLKRVERAFQAMTAALRQRAG
ncbi:MAG TPA: hypothetical protein VMT16_06145 [Thermoanaerobaculia bacterium]|nr:hypothetical protein [Thermoanaerobaculia bacterium]